MEYLLDLNECEDGTHNCSDICVNSDGGFECDCSPGFTLVNSTACEGMMHNANKDDA